MMDPFMKVTQGSFHQAMLRSNSWQMTCRGSFVLILLHIRQARNTHRSAEKAVFMYIACREIKTNRTTTSHLFFCGIFCCKKTSLLGFKGY